MKTYEEYLEAARQLHKAKRGYAQMTAGEFFGFRLAYQAMTGQVPPPYTKIG